MFCRRLIKKIKSLSSNKRGVALIMVLSAMATLAVFVGEITYTSQINQKLAYDRLDFIKAHSLAKSGLRLALLRIRAYTELKKTVTALTGTSEAAKAAANAVVPKAILEKIWSEPITIPFTGDLSALPLAARDALGKFRKDSGMEGKLYIAIDAQSSKFNLNSILSSVAAAAASPTPTPKPAPLPPGVNPTPTPTPDDNAANQYTPEGARAQLLDHIKQIFAKRAEDDQKFRDQYQSFRTEDLVSEIEGWEDISYDTIRSEQAVVPFKRAPYYDISELHYLTLMDDEIYDMIAPQFAANMGQGLNVNKIKEPVLRGLVPQMTNEEAKKFFEDRDQPPPMDGTFKSGDEFFKYLTEKVEYFKGSKSRVDELKKNLALRGVEITTDENNFKIRIEATVNQTKRTLEALVTVLETPANPATAAAGGSPTPTPTPTPARPEPTGNGTEPPKERSNLKITQIRFL